MINNFNFIVTSKFSKVKPISTLINLNSIVTFFRYNSKFLIFIKGSFPYNLLPFLPGPNTSSMLLTLFVGFTFVCSLVSFYLIVDKFSVRSLTIQFRVQHSIYIPCVILGSNRSIEEFRISTHCFHALEVQFGESLSHR